MESVSTLDALRTFEEKGLVLVTKMEVAKLFGVKEDNTAYKLLQRLKSKGVLTRVKKGLYLVRNSDFSSFRLANLLLQPSYVSLESALSYYGILAQFPFAVTSITPKRAQELQVNKKEFAYSHVKADIYWGYQKDKDFLIARPEKALLDILYFASRGMRRLHANELDLSTLNKQLLCDYVKQAKYPPLELLAKKEKLC
jgi:hypothetical protein